MAIERTLSIIKPDATRRNLTGEINARFEKAGLRIIAQRRIQLTRTQAEQFQVKVSHKCKQQTDSCELYHGCKCLGIVDALDCDTGFRTRPDRRGSGRCCSCE